MYKINTRKDDNSDMKFLDSVRSAWLSAKEGLRVCIYTESHRSIESVLGRYFPAMKKYVEDGTVYLRCGDESKGELTLTDEDLDNVLVDLSCIYK